MATATFRPSGQQDLAPSGEKSRIAANLAALELLRTVQAEQRPATADEQRVLARWGGWGAQGVAQVLDENRVEFEPERTRLRELLSPQEYAAARLTTINEVPPGSWRHQL